MAPLNVKEYQMLPKNLVATELNKNSPLFHTYITVNVLRRKSFSVSNVTNIHIVSTKLNEKIVHILIHTTVNVLRRISFSI